MTKELSSVQFREKEKQKTAKLPFLVAGWQDGTAAQWCRHIFLICHKNHTATYVTFSPTVADGMPPRIKRRST